MLGWRIGVSVVLIPALVGLFRLDHVLGERAPVLLALCLLLALRSAWELAALLAQGGLPVSFARTATAALLVVAAGWAGTWIPVGADRIAQASCLAVLSAFVLAVLLLFLSACLRYRAPGGNVALLAAEILAVLYVGLLTALTAQLRWAGGPHAGYLLLGSLVVAVKCGDIGAYTLGRLFGRRKMAPHLSPGKTWMGGGGALLGAALGAWAWLTFATPLFGPDPATGTAWTAPAAGWSLLYGVVLGAVGAVGDLSESLVKRDVGAKDASALLPGFGGLLDLLDSVLYAGPVALVLWHVLPLRTW